MLVIIAILILASSTIVSYLNSRDLVKTEMSIAESYRNLQRMEKLLSTMIDAETGRRGYFITDDPDLLESYNSASNTVDTLYTKIKAATTENPVQQANLDTLTKLIRQKFSLFEQSIKLQQVKGTSMKLHKPLMDQGNEVLAGIRRIVENMKTEEKRVLTKSREISMKTSDFTMYSMVGGASFSILLLIIAFALLTKLSSGNYEDIKSFKMSRDELETLVRDRTAEISQISLKLNNKTTEIEKLRASLNQFDKSYKSLFEQIHDSIIIYSPDTQTVLEVNSKACEVYGIKREEFLGISLKYLSKNVPQAELQVKEILAKNSYHNYQVVHYKKDGSEILMEVNAYVINYKENRAILSINREITSKVFQVV